MNYLQLAQRLREKCRISGSGPAAVTGQAGEMLRVVNWTNEAWLDIQRIHPNWNWMQADVSFNTVAQQASYTPAQCGITDLGAWDKVESWRAYPTATGTAGEQFLDWISRDEWRDLYQFSSLRTSYGFPQNVAELADRSVGLGQTPDAVYTVVGKYFKTPSSLVANTDEPGMPEGFHWLVIYRAMMMYATSEVAPEVYQEGAREFNRMVRRLEINQLPTVVLPGALC